MTKIVYAAPDYIPPPGVIVRPLHEHPAFADGQEVKPVKERRVYTWKKGRKRSQTLDNIIAYLKEKGGASAVEIAQALGESSTGNVCGIISRHPELFEKIGELPPTTNRWKSIALWGLVEEGLTMAVAGGAVPCIEVWLDNGELKTGYSTHANGDIVDDSVVHTAQRIRAGEKVFMLRQGLNFSMLKFMIEQGLYPKE